MEHFVLKILDWSEVWATALPLLVILIAGPKLKILKPIIIYLFLSLLMYVLIDMSYFHVFENNNLFYNILSIARLLFFMWFFALVDIPHGKNKRKFVTLIILFALVVIIVFTGIHNFNSFIFGVEAIVLIIYCVIYFIKTLKADEITKDINAVLLIITGLAIYESCCFFLFLFYSDLAQSEIDRNRSFAVNLWNVHNIVYIVMCLYLSRAFYEEKKYALN